MTKIKKLLFYLTLIIVIITTVSFIYRNSFSKHVKISSNQTKWFRENREEYTILFGYEAPPNAYYNKYREYRGILVDFQKELEKKLDWKFRQKNFSTWSELMNYSMYNDNFLIVGIAESESRKEFLNFTKPFIEIPYIIVTRKDSKVEKVEDLYGFKTCTVKGYAINDYLSELFPDLKLSHYPDNLDGLMAVANSEMDAMILNQAYATYIIEDQGLFNLKIAGYSGYLNPLSIAVPQGDDSMLGLMEQVVADISEARRKEIFRKWIYNEVDFFEEYGSVLIAIFISILVLFVIFWLWNLMLKKSVIRKTAEIREKVHELEVAQEKLKESEQRLELALKGANLGLWDWDLLTGRIFIDERFLEMLHYKRHQFEMSIESIKNIIHPDDLDLVMEKVKSCFGDKSYPFEHEYRLLTGESEYIWVMVRGRVIEYDNNGKPGRAAGTHLDITARKEAELELLDYKLHLEQLVDERTRQLAFKNNELERFNQLFIGREFRIKELRDKLKKLEEEQKDSW